MSSPERGGPHPEEHQRHEAEPFPYRRVVRFAGEQPAGEAYRAAQDAIYARPDSDLSVYRLQLDRIWHVAALGEAPPADLGQTLEAILATGEPTELPRGVWLALAERRAQAIQRGPWVERHHRPGTPFPDR